MKNKKLDYIVTIVLLLTIYFVGSITVYKFKHPELTETQLFFNVPNAVLWRQ